jgi:uncharacterized protein YlaN (UPF0358 family)
MHAVFCFGVFSSTQSNRRLNFKILRFSYIRIQKIFLSICCVIEYLNETFIFGMRRELFSSIKFIKMVDGFNLVAFFPAKYFQSFQSASQ